MFLLFQVDWETVRKEMVDEKGIPADIADQIGKYVKKHGKLDLVEQLRADPQLATVKDAQDGLYEMNLMLQYCDLFGILDKASGNRYRNSALCMQCYTLWK